MENDSPATLTAPQDPAPLFLPTEYQDEVIPAPQEHPDKFIRKTAEGWQLFAPGDQDSQRHQRTLMDGEIVTFDEALYFGDFSLIINDDGTFDASDADPRATHFRFDGEFPFTSIAELIENLELASGETHDIDHYHWTDPKPWRFVVDGDAARFERQVMHA